MIQKQIEDGKIVFDEKIKEQINVNDDFFHVTAHFDKPHFKFYIIEVLFVKDKSIDIVIENFNFFIVGWTN